MYTLLSTGEYTPASCTGAVASSYKKELGDVHESGNALGGHLDYFEGSWKKTFVSFTQSEREISQLSDAFKITPYPSRL
jgi:hypothetical protein